MATYATGAGPGGYGPQDEVFELLRSLGAGGFAHTYLARVVSPDLVEEYGRAEVALKIPLDRKKQRVLRQELELNAVLHLHLRKIAAPNLVRYLGFEVFRGQIVMVMEYIAGGNLRKRIGSMPERDAPASVPMPTDEAVRIAEGVLSGLHVIHQERVFHRDIKPENILMDGDVPKIADLGISRMLGSDELASTTTGTLYYMSPEILGGQGASYPSDLWAVGVVLYEMVAGRRPFGYKGIAPGLLVDLIRSEDPIPPSEINRLPEELERIILKALEKDLRRRFTSATEMLQALERFRQGRGDGVEKDIADVRAMMGAGEVPDVLERKALEIVEHFPQTSKSYQFLGEFYNRCQRYSDAVAAFRKGIRQNPSDALLRWNLALAYQKQGRHRQAIAELRKAVDIGLEGSLRRHATRLLRLLEASGS